MRYLLLISVALLMGCAGPYKSLHRSGESGNCVLAFKPVFTSALYNTRVNVIGKHLSGLLIIKTMPDSSVRMVFSNEAGFKFFDFGFFKDEFKVYSIIKEMDRKAVLKTLRKDFQLLLMSHLHPGAGDLLKSNNNNTNENYYAFAKGKDHYYYVTDTNCDTLIRMERGSSRKPVMTAIAGNFKNGIPDTVGFSHNNFSFEIGLKRIYNYAEK